MLRRLWEWRKKIVIGPVRVYQRTLARLLPPSCRFTPSCSHYMVEAVERWGLVCGVALGLWRILRCQPWGGSGDDPVPIPPWLRNKKDEDGKKGTK